METYNYEHLIDGLAHERQARMLREAELYRRLIDQTNFQFGPSRVTRARRAVARFLARLSESLEPCSDGFLEQS